MNSSDSTHMWHLFNCQGFTLKDGKEDYMTNRHSITQASLDVPMTASYAHTLPLTHLIFARPLIF